MNKMNKLLLSLLCASPLALGLASCNDSDEPAPLPETPDVEDSATDLSRDEMANCYIVQSAGQYKFKADNQFNLGPGLPVPPQIVPKSARLVWQTEQGSISSVDLVYDDGVPYIEFEVADPKGNALIAALDYEGNIVWSWHIWMPVEEVASVHSSTGYDVMNMNLGAVNATPGDPGAYGMLYQWGRKDPFPAAATLYGDVTTIGAPLYDINNQPVAITNSSWTSSANNNLAYSIANPTVCLSNYSQYFTSRDWLTQSDNTLWGNPDGYDASGDTKFPSSGRKTCYDPSPAGWRVAPADAFANFSSTGGYVWDFADFNVKDVNGDGVVDLADYNCGWQFMVNLQDALYFPAAARYDGSYAMLMGSMSGLWGSYWSNSPNSSIAGGAFCCLSFQVKGQNGEDWITVSPAGAASKADAYSVRCVRDIK